MSNNILNFNHGNSRQNLVEEGGELFLTFDADLTSFTDQCKRDFNNYTDASKILKGNQTLEETHRIPEELYWFWVQEAQAKGITAKREISNYIFNKLNSPDFAYFCVNPKYRKVQHHK